MGKDDALYRRAFRKSKWEKKQKAKKQGQTNANLNLSQFRLSVKAPQVYPKYDNDGKNIFPEPRGYAKDGGH